VSYQIRTIREPQHTRLEITGEVRAGTAKRVAQEVIDAYTKDPVQRLLVDVRELAIRVGPTETVEMVSSYRDLLNGVRSSKTAVVYREGDYETLRFYETVARNREYQTKIFTDMSQAVTWLDR
jgi:hypothetical protein